MNTLHKLSVHRGSGTIIYDPFRGDMKRRTNGWCVVEVDTEITRYYRWWLQYERHIHLQPPAWDAHISIVRGEKLSPQVQHLWRKYHGTKARFTYSHVGRYAELRSGLPGSPDNGTYYVVEVECPMLNTIRDELGLVTGWTFHLTVGRTYEFEARKPKRSKV